MTNEGSFLSQVRIKGSRADGIYRMVMKLAILSIWLKPTLGVQRVVSNHTISYFSFSTELVPLTSKNGVPFLNVFLVSAPCSFEAAWWVSQSLLGASFRKEFFASSIIRRADQWEGSQFMPGIRAWLVEPRASLIDRLKEVQPSCNTWFTSFSTCFVFCWPR